MDTTMGIESTNLINPNLTQVRGIMIEDGGWMKFVPSGSVSDPILSSGAKLQMDEAAWQSACSAVKHMQSHAKSLKPKPSVETAKHL